MTISSSSIQLYNTALCVNPSPTPSKKKKKKKKNADGNIKFDKNGREFSKSVKNTVGKEEIARYEQLLLFPQRFQKICTADTSKPGLVWEWVNQ